MSYENPETHTAETVVPVGREAGVISPTESLAFSMHGNRGVYAVLVGSGVSRAAKIPTGWEITQDLVRKLAALRKETCDPEPELWYRNTFNKDADYSDLLDTLCGTAAERQQLLRGYFEPTADDNEEGAKQPTTAHRAIAALTAKGFIRVILTTNFDRLIETALDDAGVAPAVLTTPDQLQGALPLIHTRCCVVKLHGDYRDPRIRNTQAELDSYPREFDRLLDRVFDEFGLVVCGWSTGWDGALRRAVHRAKSRRFTTYWAVRSEVGDEAGRLIEHRRAVVVRIKDADDFFGTVQQYVESLEEFARPHPLSTEAAVASLKRYLPEPRHRIRLADIVEDSVERVREAMLADASPMDDPPDRASRSEALRRHEAACSTLLALASVGGYWAEEEHVELWQRALIRLCSGPWTSVYATGPRLRKYPAVLLLYALGLGAVAVEARRPYPLRFLGRLFKTSIRENYGEDKAAVEVLVPSCVSGYDLEMLSMMRRSMYEVLRPQALRVLSDDGRYAPVFDKLEILVTLSSLHRHPADFGPEIKNSLWGYQEANWRGIMSEIHESLSSNDDDSPFVTCRIFGDTAAVCGQRLTALRDLVAKINA